MLRHFLEFNKIISYRSYFNGSDGNLSVPKLNLVCFLIIHINELWRLDQLDFWNSFRKQDKNKKIILLLSYTKDAAEYIIGWIFYKRLGFWGISEFNFQTF